MPTNTNYFNKLVDNLNNNTYAKLAVFPNGKLGFVAIKDIPPNTNPFVLTDNQNILYDFVRLSDSDLILLDDSIKELIKPLYDLDTRKYYIPFYGLNTMNFILYINTSTDKTIINLTYDETNTECELFGYKTTKTILKCQELIAPRFKFNIDKIKLMNKTNSKSNTNRKKLVLENLSKTYCKIGPTTIPTITGSGVIAIRDIPLGTNPFINTEDACYFYNSVNITKKTIDKLNEPEVKKIINDFICPDEKMKYSIPYLGFNSLNVSFFLNHSKNPNLSVVSDKCEYMGFRTNRQIRKGEELFINYRDYVDNFEELMSFQESHYTCKFMIPKNK
jgi:hypothetical protein